MIMGGRVKLNVKIETAVVPRFWVAVGDKCRELHKIFHSKAFSVGQKSVDLFHFPTSGN